MARITGFDVNSAPDQSEGFGDVYPEGEYVIALQKTDFRVNDKTHIVYLKCEAEILSRDWARRKLKFDIPFKLEDGYREDSLAEGMLKHLNIGKGQLKFLALNLIARDQAFTDSTQLHGKPVGVDLRIRDQQVDQHGKPYPPQNNVQKFMLATEVTNTPPAGTQVTVKQPAAAAAREAPATPWASAPAAAAPAPAPLPQQAPVQAPQFAAQAQPPAQPQQAPQQPLDQPQQPPAQWAQVPQAPAAPTFVVPGQQPAPTFAVPGQQPPPPVVVPGQQQPAAPSAPADATPPWLRG